MRMSDIYCTYFDHNYLSRAVLTIESLRRFDAETPIYVLALSEPCEKILRELALHRVEIIPMATLEAAYPELAGIKPTRTLRHGSRTQDLARDRSDLVPRDVSRSARDQPGGP